jgi:hypothetical protein
MIQKLISKRMNKTNKSNDFLKLKFNYIYKKIADLIPYCKYCTH